jgi:predicted DNA-binding transcriptional regulator AlpA
MLESFIKDLVRQEVALLLNSEQKKQSEQDVILNEKQALALLGISPGTAVTYRKTGRLPYMRIGRKIMYSKKELLEFLASTKRKNY